MSHENSATLRKDDRWINVPTVVRGKTIAMKEVAKRVRKGTLRPLGGKTYATEPEATAAAKRRSRRNVMGRTTLADRMVRQKTK